MKKLLSVLLTLAALAALCVPVLAAEENGEAPEKAPVFVRIWGKVSPWEEIGRAHV